MKQIGLGVVAVMVSSSVALAGGGTQKPACLSSSSQVTVQMQGGAAIVCDGYEKQCWSFAGGKPGVSVPQPAPVVPTAGSMAEVRDEAGKLSVCADAKCKKLGKKLVAAIAKARTEAAADNTTVKVEGTTDLKVVVVGGKAWSVAGDKQLKLKAPREYGKNNVDKPVNISVTAVDELLLSSWSNCAGPCSTAVIATTAGANKGASFPDGDAIILDDKRFVVMPTEAEATVSVFERHTGKLLGSVALGEGVLEGLTGTKLDDQTVLALIPADDGMGSFTARRLEVPKTGKPSLGATLFTIPACN